MGRGRRLSRRPALSLPRESLSVPKPLARHKCRSNDFCTTGLFRERPSALRCHASPALLARPWKFPLFQNRLRGRCAAPTILALRDFHGRAGSALLHKKSPSQYQGRGMPRGATLVRPAAAGLAQALNAGNGPRSVLRSPSSEAFTPPGRGKRRTKQRRAQRCLGRPSVPGALSVAARPP